MTPRSAAERGPGTPAWLDSTGSLIVRVSRPGIYEIADDGTVQRLDSAGATAAVPLDAERLARALDAAWPTHTEGEGGTGDPPPGGWRSWEVKDLALPSAWLAHRIEREYARLSADEGTDSLGIPVHASDEIHPWDQCQDPAPGRDNGMFDVYCIRAKGHEDDHESPPARWQP